MKELRGIGGARPITDDELTMAKDALVQRLPGTFGFPRPRRGTAHNKR